MSLLQKYAAEQRVYVFDFSQQAELVAGDTLQTISSVTASDASLSVGASQLFGTQKIKVLIWGGTANTIYTVTAIVVTNTGAVLEGVGLLEVL